MKKKSFYRECCVYVLLEILMHEIKQLEIPI